VKCDASLVERWAFSGICHSERSEESGGKRVGVTTDFCLCAE
jgi:hypothetical protein